MRTVKWNAFLSCLCGFAVVLGGVAVSARADVTTEKGASILIFPKVRADGVFDTVIQIANLSNMMVHARCFYVNAALQDAFTHLPCTIPSATCVPQCQETDFTIWLTKQQPTHWSVSTGRRFTAYPTFGSDDSGFSPGAVPPMSDFIGELKCIEVDDSGAPTPRNDLKGEATLVSLTTVSPAPGTLSSEQTVTGDVAKYNAIGLRANPDAAPSNPLVLDGGDTYDACPAKLILNHAASGAPDMVANEVLNSVCSGGSRNGESCWTSADCPDGGFCDPPSSEFTDLTLVPCNEDFENQIPTAVKIQFEIYNEFENKFSASTTVSCFLEVELARIDTQYSATINVNSSVFGYAVLGTDVAQTIIKPVDQPDVPTGGLVGIAERITTLQVDSATTAARAAYNLHSEGSYIPPNGPDQITMPAEP
jgi:hypothetical protein